MILLATSSSWIWNFAYSTGTLTNIFLIEIELVACAETSLFVYYRYNKLGGGPITSVSFSYEQMNKDQ